MLAGRRSELEEVQSLELGADAYVVKPVSWILLRSWIRSLLRRAAIPPARVYRPDYARGGLTISFRNCEMAAQGQRIKLTPIEAKLLAVLVRHPGRLLSYERLSALIWGPGVRQKREELQVYISRLRTKLQTCGAGSCQIQGERRLGYRFDLLPC
jgi:DNA-binding response OmpR family regulator